jgi:hypothetical protein
MAGSVEYPLSEILNLLKNQQFDFCLSYKE